MSEPLSVFFDGLCEPVNPGGHGCYGFVVKRGEEVVHEQRGYLGRTCKESPMTNNVAEYCALIKAIEWVASQHPNEHIALYGDSKLVVEQVSGRWKINSPVLRLAVLRALSLLESFRGRYTIEWVPRESNSHADRLSVEAYVNATGDSVRHRKAKP